MAHLAIRGRAKSQQTASPRGSAAGARCVPCTTPWSASTATRGPIRRWSAVRRRRSAAQGAAPCGGWRCGGAAKRSWERPHPFDTQVQRPVGRDGRMRFDGRQYGVPFACVGRAVQVRGCAATVEIYGGPLCDELSAAYGRPHRSTVLRGGAPRSSRCAHRSLDAPPNGSGCPGVGLWQAATRPLDGYAALVERAGRPR